MESNLCRKPLRSNKNGRSFELFQFLVSGFLLKPLLASVTHVLTHLHPAPFRCAVRGWPKLKNRAKCLTTNVVLNDSKLRGFRDRLLVQCLLGSRCACLSQPGPGLPQDPGPGLSLPRLRPEMRALRHHDPHAHGSGSCPDPSLREHLCRIVLLAPGRRYGGAYCCLSVRRTALLSIPHAKRTGHEGRCEGHRVSEPGATA